jgi:6-pyruvoyltetrahydropterin/6-carboxytetrahydropterin synthase
MFEVFKEFTFEAAHQLAVNVGDGHHPYARLHGHSFKVEIFLRGDIDPMTNWVVDFGEIDRKLQDVREQLDHHYLNDIEGLEVPTLECISRWIWQRLHKSLPSIDRVLVRRGSCGEGCVFSDRVSA